MTADNALQSPSRDLPRWVWVLLTCASLGLLGYTSYRAVAVPLTYDEVWSLNSYVRAPWREIIAFRPVGANNHVGNSLLTKLCWLVSDSPLSLRLPNLIAHAIYLIYTIALARRMRQGVWVLLAFFLLNSNPFLLDFFSLSRGYGLALAMTMGALYHLFAFRENAFSRHLFWNVIFASLAVLCNLSFLHFYLANAFVLLLLIYSYSRAWSEQWREALSEAAKRIAPLIFASLALYLYLRGPIRAMVEAKELYYGGGTGFWTNTVFSLAHATIYKIDYWRHDVEAILWVVIASLVAMFVAFVIEVHERRGSLRASPGALAFLLMIVPAVVGTIQHFEMGSLFLIYRTALFLVPIYMLGLAWLLRSVAKVPEFRKGVVGLSVLLTLALTINAARAFNTTHCSEWIVDADNRQILQDIATDRKGNQGPVTLRAHWQLLPSLRYHRDQDPAMGAWLANPEGDACTAAANYCITLGDECGSWLPPDQRPFGEKQGCTLVRAYPISGARLWRCLAQ